MAHYSDSVRDDNTDGTPQEGVYSSASVGRRQKRGMKAANDAARYQRPSMGKRERKSQLRMRMR